ncbi:hypothetical protein [Gandjariella thermophila]|uniref:Uncharacterized protein n=1 Tax=Gandjariella thermophila TaxID=1931992 RepID=A0A4D4JDI8_9PSEU|nr:hypothetical protein [Gandjariella thermophila]GDY32429.1 hypothetical protein GTS_40620 [Gandjariella thermophila]
MSEAGTPTKRAGLFDLRWVIALLFGFYGIVLLVVGIAFTTEADTAKAGTNLNLWSGLGMLGLAILFAAWAQLRPLRVPTAASEGAATGPADDADGAGER